MAETPPSSSSPPSDGVTHWCYNCTSHVSVENQSPDLPDIVCRSCKGGFVVESAPSSSSSQPALPPAAPTTPPQDSSPFDSDYVQFLRLVARSRDESPPVAAASMPPLRPWDDDGDDDEDDDFLRIEFDGWGNGADGGDEEYEADYFDEMEGDHGRDGERQPRRQRSGDLFGRRVRDFISRMGAGRRSPLLDWAEIIRGLEDYIIKLRVEMLDESDRYFENPEDYVDATEHEVLLQTLMENDGGVRRGAPPTARLAVTRLLSVVIRKMRV